MKIISTLVQEADVSGIITDRIRLPPGHCIIVPHTSLNLPQGQPDFHKYQ